MTKKKLSTGGLVYSTNPSSLQEEEVEEPETLVPTQQLLKVRVDSKHRSGKTVTLVAGFVGREQDLETLGKTLKTKCGTGGSVKDGEIIIQGDNKQKVILVLQQLNYKVKA